MKQKSLKLLLLVIFLSVILNLVYLFVEWFALTPNGSYAMIAGASFYGLLILAAVAVFVICLPVLFFKEKKEDREPVIFIMWACVIYSFITIYIMPFRIQIRTREFHNLTQRAQMLIIAIENYTNDIKLPPSRLEDLVPKYITYIPSTGMGAYPEYKYIVVKDGSEWRRNPWVLYVETPIGSGNADMFIYLPLQNYPERGVDSKIQRIEAWAYLHR